MQYFIFINQLELSKTELDLKDCAILYFLYFICSSRNKKIEKQRVDNFTWIDYNYLLREMPLLRIKKGSLSGRITKIKKAGFIETKKGHTQKLYIKLTEKVDSVFTNMNTSVQENEHSTESSVHENEQTNILDNNIDSNTTILSGQLPSSEEKDEFTWPAYLKEMLKDKRQHIKIIASFFRKKNIEFSSRKQVQSAIARHSRAATKLVPFSNKDLRWAAIYCKNKWGVVGIDWTLDTMLKALSSVNRKTDGKDVSQKRKSTKYKDLIIKEVEL